MTEFESPTPIPATPAEPTAVRRTNVALVLDSSLSMQSMRDEAIAMFNAQRDAIAENVEKSGETRVTLVVFGEIAQPYRTVVEGVAPDQVGRLTKDSYCPENGTPMRDGIASAIAVLEKQDDGGADTANLVIVITDGQENQSREWSAEALSKKVTELQGTGRWTFALYGCSDMDLTALRANSGFATVPKGNLGMYDRGAAGMDVHSAAMVSSTVAYMDSRSVGLTATSDFADSGDGVGDPPSLPKTAGNVGDPGKSAVGGTSFDVDTVSETTADGK